MSPFLELFRYYDPPPPEKKIPKYDTDPYHQLFHPSFLYSHTVCVIVSLCF